MTGQVVFFCNALDDHTRIERGIATDSPAASRKVFLAAKALIAAGVPAQVLSLGRGRQDGSGRLFGTTVRNVDGVPTTYLPFLNLPLLSAVVSLVAPLLRLARLSGTDGPTTIVFYNRFPVYVPFLLAAALLRFRTVLDIEDGDRNPRGWSPSELLQRLMRWIFDRVCSGGALLACSQLLATTRLRPVLCYYGVCEQVPQNRDWSAPRITILMSGTIARDTGAQMLAGAIKAMRAAKNTWCEQIRIEVTGKGNAIDLLAALAAEDGAPRVVVHGRLTDERYRAVAAAAHVGLALKPNTGPLAHTTFPSKVIEFAGAGQLVVSTDISDVRAILGDGALYLETDDPGLLVERLRWIVSNRAAAAAMAETGARAAWNKCAPAVAGRQLADFLGRPHP